MEKSNLSRVNVPITMKIKEIEETINNQIEGVFYENSEVTNDETEGVKIKAEKTENISISLDGSYINYRVPLKLRIKKGIAFTSIEAEGEIALSLSTEYKIEKNWKLTTHTKVIEYKWLQKPHLHLGIIDLPIKFIANTILKKSKTLLCTTLDKELAKNFDLQSYVNEAWKMLQSPILMAEEFNLWLNISPVKVGMTPLISDGETIKSTVMVQTYANALIGEKPKSEKQLQLPPYQLLDDLYEDFHLSLNTEINYLEAEKIMKKYVIGQTFSRWNRSVKVENIAFYGKAEKVVIETKLTGSFNGDICLKWKPDYNPEKKEIEAEKLEYELKTNNILIRFINWLFNRRIKKILKKQIDIQINENLTELSNKIKKELENYEISENVFLRGNLSKLDVESIQSHEKGLNLTIDSAGKLNLLINKITIKKEDEN